MRTTGVAALAASGLGAGLLAQDGRQVIRSRADLVTSDVGIRDARGRFVADLKPSEFEVYEDGVRQQIVSFVLSHGGRLRAVDGRPPVVPEGIALPASRPVEEAGRVFVVFIDDQHLDPRNTPRIRDLVRRISTELICEGDMFAVPRPARRRSKWISPTTGSAWMPPSGRSWATPCRPPTSSRRLRHRKGSPRSVTGCRR